MSPQNAEFIHSQEAEIAVNAELARAVRELLLKVRVPAETAERVYRALEQFFNQSIRGQIEYAKRPTAPRPPINLEAYGKALAQAVEFRDQVAAQVSRIEEIATVGGPMGDIYLVMLPLLKQQLTEAENRIKQLQSAIESQ
jgi:hypothetical protein